MAWRTVLVAYQILSAMARLLLLRLASTDKLIRSNLLIYDNKRHFICLNIFSRLCTTVTTADWRDCRTIPTFYSVQRRNSAKEKTPTSFHERKTGWCQWALILIFCVDVNMELTLPSPRQCAHASIWAWPPSPSVGRHNGWFICSS